jgi:hypothetical protein
MRFVPVKTAEQQAALMLVGVRDRLIRNRTQLSNAVRGQAAEFGLTAAKGLAHLIPLLERIEADDDGLPALARDNGFRSRLIVWDRIADPIWASGVRAASTGRTHDRCRTGCQTSRFFSCIRRAVHTCRAAIRAKIVQCLSGLSQSLVPPWPFVCASPPVRQRSRPWAPGRSADAVERRLVTLIYQANETTIAAGFGIADLYR